jgi:hypothetical protein
MDETRKPESITFFEHEAEVARQERHIKRLSIFCAVVFAAFVFSNLGWIIYESQYQKVQTTVTQDASSEGGNATIYGEHAGAVINGESKTDSNNDLQSQEK